MNKFYKSAIVAVAAAMVSHAAQAVQSDMQLGFTESTASADYIINLGLPSTAFLTSTTVVDLSSDFSATTFNSVFGSSATGVNMGVVAGNNTAPLNNFETQVRAGGAGNAAVAGSGAALVGLSTSSTVLSGGAAVLTGNTAWPTTPGTGATDANKTYTSKVEASTAASFFGKTGVQVAGTIGASGIIYEDLWKATTAGFAYQGYFTFNDNTDSLTFTSLDVTPAPEPATYGALAGLGVLALALRRQFSRKTA